MTEHTTAPGQRDRLLARQRPFLPYPILVDPEAETAARARLQRAQQLVRQARINGSDLDRTETAAELAAAEAEVAGCYETIILRAVDPDLVEELIAAHPPTDEQMAAAKTARDAAKQRGEIPDPWPAWNNITFRPVLLAESADGDMTVDDWAAMLAGRMSVGEIRGLWAACMAINLSGRAADPVVLPKGLMTTSN